MELGGVGIGCGCWGSVTDQGKGQRGVSHCSLEMVAATAVGVHGEKRKSKVVMGGYRCTIVGGAHGGGVELGGDAVAMHGQRHSGGRSCVAGWLGNTLERGCMLLGAVMG